MQGAGIEFNPLYIDQVYDRLLEFISFGELQPGERIRQSVLAERLGVSRQPISHALQLLKHQGLVRDAGKQGVEVAPLDGEYIVQLYAVRSVLEEKAGFMAAQSIKSDANTVLKNHLSEALAHGEQALRNRASRAELVRADYRFHMALYRLSGNTVIEQMMTGQWPHIMRSMMALLEYGFGDTAATAWQEHAQITTHILAGESAQAASACARHLQRAERELRERLAVIGVLAVK